MTQRGPVRVAVTIGDPSGIGPEIVVKSLSSAALRAKARYRIYGCGRTLERAARTVGVRPFWRTAGANMSDTEVLLIDDASDQFAEPSRDAAPGPTAEGGRCSLAWVERAIAAAKLSIAEPMHADAIVTAPISKTSWNLAGMTQFPGHTELLAERFGARRSGMLFVSPSLRVMLVTIHVPLMRVGAMLTTERVLESIELAHEACVNLGIERPRIGVCGLNPHAGEGGILGEEDDLVIAPAIARARQHGVDASGPHPGDTVFAAAAAPPIGAGRYDCVVAMYHDQGLIPVKVLHRHEAVNVTVGLPNGIVRTSPAHGTAFDIAGKSLANERSMTAAIELAVNMAST